MPKEVSLAVVTAVLGLLTAGVLALINSWITTRAGIDVDLRSQRLKVYPTLWKATCAVSRWPRMKITRGQLEKLHEIYRSWYYDEGGLFLSESARARYGDVQQLIATLLEHQSPREYVLVEDLYTELMLTTSALRTALTEDLDTRRRRSVLETWRRSHWHNEAAKEAKARIKLARENKSAFAVAEEEPGS
jgi:hypothetical protein